MCTALAFIGLTPGRGQALGCVRVGSFCADQGTPGLIADQHLRPQFHPQVFNVLCPRQQTRLLGVRRIKTHTVLHHGMAAFNVDHFTRLQQAACSQRIVKTGRGVATLQPVCHQG